MELQITDSFYNEIFKNKIEDNNQFAGIYLTKSKDNAIYGNDIDNPQATTGIDLHHSSDNVIFYNLIKNNHVRGGDFFIIHFLTKYSAMTCLVTQMTEL